MSDSHMHEADASSAEAEASFSTPSDAAAPDFLRFEPPAELIETAPLVSSSLGSSLGRTRRLRRDGWTAAARRAFLERLARRARRSTANRRRPGAMSIAFAVP